MTPPKKTKAAPAPAPKVKRMGVTQDMIITALRQNLGTVAVTARQLGISREHLHRRIQRSPKLQAAIAEAREAFVDVAELQLAKKVHDGDLGAVRYVLGTQGRARGYGAEITHNHKGRVDFTRMTDEELETFIAQGGDPNDPSETPPT